MMRSDSMLRRGWNRMTYFAYLVWLLHETVMYVHACDKEKVIDVVTL